MYISFLTVVSVGIKVLRLVSKYWKVLQLVSKYCISLQAIFWASPFMNSHKEPSRNSETFYYWYLSRRSSIASHEKSPEGKPILVSRQSPPITATLLIFYTHATASLKRLMRFSWFWDLENMEHFFDFLTRILSISFRCYRCSIHNLLARNWSSFRA